MERTASSRTRTSSIHVPSLVLLAALAPAACGGGAAEQRGPGSVAAHAPSPGPRAEDAIDDQGLAALEADARGRGGDDAARAELRLLTAQVRAFVVAAVHAMPLGPTRAGGANEARFDPPATLSRQLGAPHECEHGGDAHACAERLATRLLERINVLVPPHDLAGIKDSLLTAMAALEESRVPISSEARWRVLREGDDPAAHIAQALTLVVISRHVGQCVATSCSAGQGARLAAALSEELAIGACSDALERVASAADDDAGQRAALAALAQAGCAPECARTALEGRGDDPLEDAARACRAEHTTVAFAPFARAAQDLAGWRTGALARLEPVEAQDAAVRDVMQGRAQLPAGTTLPMAPALFQAGDGRAIALPSVPDGEGRGVSAGSASLVAWVGRDGSVLIDPAARFALDLPATAPGEGAAPTTSPLDGLHAALAQAEGQVVAGAAQSPRAVALAADAPATRTAPALEQAARGGEGPGSLVELAVRHGVASRFVALRITPAASAAHVLRVNERSITLVDNGLGVRVVDLVPPTPGQPDTLNGAVPAEGAPTELAIQLEPDATGATLVRVADALAVAGGRANPTIVPGFVPQLADGALVFNVTDAAHATALRAAVDAHRAEALRCLESIPVEARGGTAGGAETLPPRVDLHLVLDAHGRVTQASASSLSARDEHAAQCVQTAARRWHFAAPGGAAEVRVPYVLLGASAGAGAAHATPAHAAPTAHPAAVHAGAAR